MSGAYRPENTRGQKPTKAPILGEGHSLSDEEGQMIQRMIREEQHSARALSIPKEDLAAEATTKLSPEAASVINASHVREVLQLIQPRLSLWTGALRRV